MELGWSATDFRVRRAVTDDAALLATVAARLFTDAFAEHNRPEDIEAYLASAFSKDVQQGEIADTNSIIWVAENEGQFIGYAHIKLGSAPRSVALTRPVELSRIYADRAWHGRGVGAELLKRCIDAASEWGSTALWLGVWEENPRGIAFYKKHGFRVAGGQVFQLGRDAQRDLIMVRDMSLHP